MRNFVWIFRHYLQKNFLTPANLLIIALPLTFIFAFNLLDIGVLYGIAIPLVLGSQFFGADLTANWLHHDMKGSTRSRLLVSPVAPHVFHMAVMTAGCLFNVLYGSIVVAFTAIAFGVEWGNYGLVLVVLLALSFITQMVGVLIFRFTKDEKSSSRISYVFAEVMMLVVALPIVINNVADLSATFANILNHLPVSAGMNIIANDNLLYNMAVLLGMVAAMTAVAFLVGRGQEEIKK